MDEIQENLKRTSLDDVAENIDSLARCIELLAERQRRIMQRRDEILQRITELQNELQANAKRLIVVLTKPEEQ